MAFNKTAVDVRVQAPIGGWNTRDSFDDIPPTDAIVMDNWLPGLGAVAIRGGKEVHGVASGATGPDLVLNGSFTNGFDNWTQIGSAVGWLDTVNYHTAPNSAKVPYESPTARIEQSIACSASTDYAINFWYLTTGTPPAPGGEPRYVVYDETNAVDILEVILDPAIAWEQVAATFTTPVGCLSISIKFVGSSAFGTEINFDDIVLSEAEAVPNPVETLMSFDATVYRELISADNGAIRNSTAQGAPITLGTGFTSNQWDWTNFDGKLIMVNGVDVPQEYDGVALGALAPALVGPTNPIGCHAFKNRMYYWDNVSQDVWYTALLASAGTCTKFELSKLTKFGGNLIATETWTMDGGTGPDDHLVFIMSSGEVIVYQGSSPASVSNWALVGIYDIGVPLCARCSVKFGPDLVIMTDLDIISMSKIIQGPEALAERSKVSGAMERVVQFIGSDFFEAVLFPTKKLGIFSVPAPGGQDAFQFVQNLVTGSWCRFTGWNSHSWVTINEELYFGGDFGTVYKAFTGTVDNYWDGSELVIEPIEAELQTAWLDFGSGDNKSFNAFKPIFDGVGSMNYNFDLQTDFAPFKSIPFPDPIFEGQTPWYSPWYSPWGAAKQVKDDWKIIRGYGRWAGAVFKHTATTVINWAATIWHIEQGTRM